MVPLLSKLCKAQKKRGERLELCRTHEKMGGPRGRGRGGGIVKVNNNNRGEGVCGGITNVLNNKIRKGGNAIMHF